MASEAVDESRRQAAVGEVDPQPAAAIAGQSNPEGGALGKESLAVLIWRPETFPSRRRWEGSAEAPK